MKNLNLVEKEFCALSGKEREAFMERLFSLHNSRLAQEAEEAVRESNETTTTAARLVVVVAIVLVALCLS